MVIDFSLENQRFALELAAAAEVTIDYAVCDVLKAADLNGACDFDVLVLELGILHYHQDLDLFFAVMRKLAVRGGTLVLNEFHPLQRKLFWTQGPRDYLQTKLTEADVPNPDAAGASLGKCLYRFWTMGEIVTAVIKAGFIVLMGPVNIFLLIAGFFLLPVAVILMAAWIFAAGHLVGWF